MLPGLREEYAMMRKLHLVVGVPDVYAWHQTGDHAMPSTDASPLSSVLLFAVRLMTLVDT
eukprot:172239-Rhodomonas_salina.3